MTTLRDRSEPTVSECSLILEDVFKEGSSRAAGNVSCAVFSIMERLNIIMGGRGLETSDFTAADREEFADKLSLHAQQPRPVRPQRPAPKRPRLPGINAGSDGGKGGGLGDRARAVALRIGNASDGLKFLNRVSDNDDFFRAVAGILARRFRGKSPLSHVFEIMAGDRKVSIGSEAAHLVDCCLSPDDRRRLMGCADQYLSEEESISWFVNNKDSKPGSEPLLWVSGRDAYDAVEMEEDPVEGSRKPIRRTTSWGGGRAVKPAPRSCAEFKYLSAIYAEEVRSETGWYPDYVKSPVLRCFTQRMGVPGPTLTASDTIGTILDDEGRHLYGVACGDIPPTVMLSRFEAFRTLFIRYGRGWLPDNWQPAVPGQWGVISCPVCSRIVAFASQSL